MIASVYIKDSNIHFYNEKNDLTGIGGIAYELGRPLLDFICYEPERFEEGFSTIASTFDNEYAHIGAKEPEFIAGLKELMSEMQQSDVYVCLYNQILMDFIYTFIESPGLAVEQLSGVLLDAEEKLSWVADFEWPATLPGKVFYDKDKRLYQAIMEVIAIMTENFKLAQVAITQEIEWLLEIREGMGAPETSSMEYLFALEELHKRESGEYFIIETPFLAFYGVVDEGVIVELYEINNIQDLFCFEFVKMIEQDIFIKKCKNCGRFFIPRRRADAEYCERLYGETGRKCSEIGATLRYERKVAENPILEAHKKAYRRFHSRVRAKKMTQNEFRLWSDEAIKKRDECIAGALSFEEFVAWLEQGRVRKARDGGIK